MSEALKAKWRSGTRKPNPPETSRKAGETLRRLYREGKLHRPVLGRALRKQIGRKVSVAHKGKVLRKTPVTAQEKRAMAERTAANPLLGKFETNMRARDWAVRSPVNKVYRFHNLAHFVRNNPDLFLPTDVIWSGRNNGKCRATQGIMSICPRCKRCVGSWKGWTWYSVFEEKKNFGRDLLDRNILKRRLNAQPSAVSKMT